MRPLSQAYLGLVLSFLYLPILVMVAMAFNRSALYELPFTFDLVWFRELAGNQRLEMMLLDQLYYQLRLYRYRSSAKSGRALVAFDEHVAIVDAIENNDPDAAEEAMRTHIFDALSATNWVLGGPHGAAARLGMKRTTLASRMEKLGIMRQHGTMLQ